MRKFFGTDGIRSEAGVFPLTAAWTLRLGEAAAEVLQRHAGTGTSTGNTPSNSTSNTPSNSTSNIPLSVVIGRDTRKSGDMLEAALAAGLTARGINVIHLGVIPTPGVSYLTRHLKAVAGVVISASHNAFEDNGIKFFSSSGEKLADSLEHEIETALEGDLPVITGKQIGTVTDYREAERLYADFLRGHAPDLNGMRIALDCANGATFRIAPRVFQQAGADVFAIHTTPDGKNINLNCGSTHPEGLCRVVRENGFDLGIAFDGDGDRAILVDGDGELFHGDHILYAAARQRGESAVVATIMSNMGLEVKLREHGITLERSAVGDRYVHERLIERGLTLGGEQSGHLLFLDLAPTGDGILTALQVLHAVSQSGQSLAHWRAELIMFPQTLQNVRLRTGSDKQALAAHPQVQAAVAEAEVLLAGRGRINLRPSGTEALIRVMVEGEDQPEIEAIAGQVAAVITLVNNL
jgi:phosphoglucosamine mutase